MADLQKKILSEFGFDILQENIFKLYKINDANITPQDIQKSIDSTRKRWNQSINGANEKNAERDRARLEKADKYEAVLKNEKLRKELFAFYNKGGEAKAVGVEGATSGLTFARDYFALIQTSKRIKKSDVEFFFEYYPSERKNKKAILEMLEKELKVRALGKEDKYADEDTEAETTGKKKDDKSPLITNLFQEDTIVKLQRCVEFYSQAQQNETVCQKYPEVRGSLYDFLGLNNIDDIALFSSMITERSKEVYQVKQERGRDFLPLSDLFNKLNDVSSNKDVVDNFSEFKLLIKYPSLSPYMFSFTEMKPKTLKGISAVASKEYMFRDDSDFILNYYNPIYDNFGIVNSGAMSAILKKAEKKAGTNKILHKIDEKLGTSLGAQIIHWAVYFPILAVYLVFETFKAIFTELHKISIPIFVALFLGENWLFPKLLGSPNLLYLRKIFSKKEWLAYLEDFLGDTMRNGFEVFLMSLIAIIILLALYILPALLVSLFVFYFATDLNERYDWGGYERTFQNIFKTVRNKTKDQFFKQRKTFYKTNGIKVLINIICVALVVAVVHFVPIGFKAFSEKTGYFQKTEKVSKNHDDTQSSDSESDNSQEPKELDETDLATMVITESSANIRSGPGTDYDVITAAQKGDTFLATGNEETASNGRIWYEIYLDESKETTGWASEKVISPQ